MRHATENFGSEAGGGASRHGPLDRARTNADRLRAEALERSATTPYRQFSYVLAVLYLMLLALAGLIARITARRGPDELVIRLADHYLAVPEMALHKCIEIRSFAMPANGEPVLDLGCGDGIVGGLIAAEAGLKGLWGLDLSAIEPEVVEARGYDRYIQGNVCAIPLPDASVEHVMSVCVVEHIHSLEGVVAEAARVVRPGGWFWFTTPNPRFRNASAIVRLLAGLGRHRGARRWARRLDFRCAHHHYLDREQWRERLHSHGFERVEVRPIFSRGQFLIYDLMNIQAYCLSFYLYDRIRWLHDRVPGLAGLTRWATRWIVAALGYGSCTESAATHWAIACYRKESINPEASAARVQSA